MIIASIMTGTSVDSVDIAIVNTKEKKTLDFFSFPFSVDEKTYIESFLWPNKKLMNEISEFNFEFSRIVGKYFNLIDVKKRSEIEYVVYHGQTTFHDASCLFNKWASTMQLGNGAMLSQCIHKNVICDLRSSDVANGQNGAPLVGIGDKEIFWKEGKGIVVFNVGGISNITIINEEGEIQQYDLGPGNSLMDAFVKKEFNLPYDDGGLIASKGKVVEKLFEKLIDDEFILAKPPKSTGKEKYNIEFLNSKVNGMNLKNEDILKTLLAFTAYAMGQARVHSKNIENYDVYIAGGGEKNKALVNELKQYYPNIRSTSVLGIDPQAREAVSFAFLGSNYVNNIKNGTGKIKSIFGCLYKY